MKTVMKMTFLLALINSLGCKKVKLLSTVLKKFKQPKELQIYVFWQAIREPQQYLSSFFHEFHCQVLSTPSGCHYWKKSELAVLLLDKVVHSYY